MLWRKILKTKNREHGTDFKNYDLRIFSNVKVLKVQSDWSFQSLDCHIAHFVGWVWFGIVWRGQQTNRRCDGRATGIFWSCRMVNSLEWGIKTFTVSWLIREELHTKFISTWEEWDGITVATVTCLSASRDTITIHYLDKIASTRTIRCAVDVTT